jgi:hypothetical protein
MRASFNSFTVDGVNVVSTVTGYQSAGGNNASYNLAGGTNGIAAVDAVEEFRIVTGSFAAEYGRNAGAHVLILTRSGGNRFHGTAFEFFRNDKLDAADWFVNQAAQPNPRLRSNDFGAALGGPILHNRIFFFVSQESQRLAQPQFTIAAVPSLAARNIAPAVVRPFLDAFPLPNGPALGGDLARFSAGYSNPLRTDSAFIRSDQVLTGNLRGFATFTYAPSARTSRSNNGSASLADSNVQHVRVRSLTAGLTWIASPSMVNNLRLNFADSVNQSRFTMDTFGGATVPVNDLLLAGTTPVNYFSFVSLGDPGGDLFGGNSGTLNERQINIVDATTLVRGAHQLKFGVDDRLLLPFINAAGDQYFQFNHVDGLVSNHLDAFHNTAPSRARTEITSLSFYAQDTWRVATSLNLTYGLRWDFNSVPRSLDPNNGNLVSLVGNYAMGDVKVGRPGASLWKQRYANFAPRLGLAWQPVKSIVLRAGGGLFHDTGIAEASSQPWVTGPAELRAAGQSGRSPFARAESRAASAGKLVFSVRSESSGASRMGVERRHRSRSRRQSNRLAHVRGFRRPEDALSGCLSESDAEHLRRHLHRRLRTFQLQCAPTAVQPSTRPRPGGQCRLHLESLDRHQLIRHGGLRAHRVRVPCFEPRRFRLRHSPDPAWGPFVESALRLRARWHPDSAIRPADKRHREPRPRLRQLRFSS